MEYKEYRVKTNDGEAALNAWYFPAKVKSTQLILISHNGEGNMADYLRRVDQFRQTTNVLIYDYRGFGSSSDFRIDPSMAIYPHFIDDLTSMIDFAKQTFSEELSLYGWGIGAGLSAGVGHHRGEVRRIVADTPFLSMEDLEDRFASNDIPMTVPNAGFDKSYNPAYALQTPSGNKALKYLVIIGSKDLLYKPSDMEALFSTVQKRVTSIEVFETPPGGDHFRANKAAYMKAINRFLTES